MGFYHLTLIDAAGKKSGFTLETGPINAATLANVQAQCADFLAALDPVIRANVEQEELLVFRNILQPSPPTDQLARRHDRWLVNWIDTTQYMDPPVNSILNPYYGKMFTDTISGADGTQTISGKNEVDITAAPWAAFVTAFQALTRSHANGQPQVTAITFIDR